MDHLYLTAYLQVRHDVAALSSRCYRIWLQHHKGQKWEATTMFRTDGYLILLAALDYSSLLLVPYCQNQHWVLYILDVSESVIIVYDPLWLTSPDIFDNPRPVLRSLCAFKFIAGASQHTHLHRYSDVATWTVQLAHERWSSACPRQLLPSSCCGLHVLLFTINYLNRNHRPSLNKLAYRFRRILKLALMNQPSNNHYTRMHYARRSRVQGT